MLAKNGRRLKYFIVIVKSLMSKKNQEKNDQLVPTEVSRSGVRSIVESTAGDASRTYAQKSGLYRW
jgi:hypothetical protein